MDKNISIVIPVYNGEKSIFIPLESLMKQSYRNFEVIVIDDGSSDGTAGAVEKYCGKDTRCSYIHQSNSGVAAARNKGLEIAKGRFVCFLDSDDYYYYDFLERMFSRITASEKDVCYCGYNIITPTKPRRRRTGFKEGDILLHYILEQVVVHTSGWMIRRSLLDRHDLKFTEGISWGEDIEFFCAVLARTQVVTCVRDYLTNYRSGFNDQQLSAFSLDKLDHDFDSIKRILNNEDVNRNELITKALVDYRLPALLTYRLLEALNRGESKEAIRAYFQKYEDFLTKLSWNNGLKSLKLNLNKIKLMNNVRRNMH